MIVHPRFARAILQPLPEDSTTAGVIEAACPSNELAAWKVPVLINTPRNATFREYPAKDCRFLFYFLKPGKLQLCACRLSFGVEQQVETTPDSRLPSNGMSSGFMRGSSMSFLLPALRTSFEGHSIQEKTTTSPSSALTARLKSVTLPSGRSSP